MDNMTLDDNDIDAETLQAQIDVSMSFAQNLVASWVPPSSKLPVRPQTDIETELKEYMRRPARLGVGATIPESAQTSQTVEQLRYKLGGKSKQKRSRDDDAMEVSPPPPEEEESRAGAIKKKTKIDPFNVDVGKKRKKKKKVPYTSADTLSSSVLPPISSQTTASSSSNHRSVETTPIDVKPLESVVCQDLHLGNSASDKVDKPNMESQTANGSVVASRKTLGIVGTPSSATSLSAGMTAHRKSELDVVLKQPLLNLQPVPDHTRQSEKDSSPPARKKRRRKKKKKRGVDEAPIPG